MTKTPRGIVARVRRTTRSLGRRAQRRSSPRTDVPARPADPGPATAPGAPAGPSASRRHLVVVSYGRSGSTLVQGLLNALPRCLVRGENDLYVLRLFRAFHHSREFRRKHLGQNPFDAHSAFYGLDHLRPQTFVRSTRRLVRQHLLGDHRARDVDVLGFKEVAWYRVGEDEVAPFADFLDLVLPGCHYVLLQRNVDDVLVSGFWKNFSDEVARDRIRRVERFQSHLRETRAERVLDLRYEQLAGDAATRDASMVALAEFAVGRCDDELLETLRATAAKGHGPFPFGTSRGARQLAEEQEQQREQGLPDGA